MRLTFLLFKLDKEDIPLVSLKLSRRPTVKLVQCKSGTVKNKLNYRSICERRMLEIKFHKSLVYFIDSKDP